MEAKHPKNGFIAFWQDGHFLIRWIGPILSAIWWVFVWWNRKAPEFKELSYAWGFLPLLIWVLFCYLNRWKEFQKIAESLTPKFKLSLQFTGYDVPKTDSEVLLKFINILVKNSSERNLENCSAYLSGLFKDNKPTPYESNVPLVWNDPKTNGFKTIVAKGEGLVHVVTSGSHGHNLKLYGKQWNRFKDVFNDSAVYRFKVLVNCGGVSNEIEFEVTWNGKWDEVKAKEI